MWRLSAGLLVGFAVAASVLTAPALAADLPPPAAPPPQAPVAYIPAAPAFSWTGFYVGLNAGYAFGQSNWTSPMGSTGWFNVSGPLAGGTIGGNYQIGQLVIGAEGDIDWQNVKGSLSATPSTACCFTRQAAAPLPTSRQR
jgi:outer membrane immunogenic protein